MISRLVITFLPPDGETVSSFTLQSNAIGSSSDYAMAAPSASPSPAPSPIGCPPYTPFTLQISQSLANEMNPDGIGPYLDYIESVAPAGYFANTDNQQDVLTLVASPVPASLPNNTWFDTSPLGNTPCKFYVTVTYEGYQTPQSSIPGVTVPPELKPLPAPPALPIMPEIAPIVQAPLQQAIAEIEPILAQQQAQITGQIEQQFDSIGSLINKIPGKIGDQLINTMGQTYGVGVGLGLDVPTMEEIQTGTVNFNPPTPKIPETISPEPLPVPISFPSPSSSTIQKPILPPTPTPTTTQSQTSRDIPPPGFPPCPPGYKFMMGKFYDGISPPRDDPQCVFTGLEPGLPSEPVEQKCAAPAPPTCEEEYKEAKEEAKKAKEKEEDFPLAAPLKLPSGNLKPNKTPWENAEACSTPAQPGAFDSRLLWALFGWENVSGNEYKPPDWLDPTNWPIGSKSIASFLMNMFGMSIQTLNKVSIASMPITNNIQDFMVLAMGGVVEKWVGAPILPFLQGTIYNINYNNPQIIPGIPDLQGLFRKGAISEDVFRCLVRANGSYDSWQMKIAESSTLVPSLYDIIRLYRGKKIGGNEFEYYANLNGLKISTPQGKTDIATFLEATRAIPGVADLVRMMVRDAADNTIALKYETDSGFDKKFAGQLEEWSEQQGVDPEIMKYYWRAHWEIPSNTQLFDMLHKLRPNRRVGAVPANIVTTKETVKEAIQVNDLTPYWVDRVMATSYSSLTRIDAQRAFFIEAINEDQLFDAYMDLGYDADNAQVLVDFTKELKRKRDSNLPGADKPANIISQLKKYVISETNAYDRLIATGMKPQKAKQAVANSVRDRKEEARARCLKEAQRRFFRAEYDLLKYKSVVMQLGIPQENIEALVNETACLYDSRGKEINAGALCKAFKQNIITADQFQERLRLIGYDREEAFIIAESCKIDEVIALGKAKLAIQAKEKAESEKAKKAEEKRKKDEEKAKEKAKKAKEAEEKKKAKEQKEPV
jgi:hypothetical protein